MYSQGLRARLIQRMSGPRATSATALSKETGVSQQTLSRWLREASTLQVMGDRDNETRGSQQPQQWTVEEKLRVVIAAAQLSESELGEFLRREGLHTAQLEEWRHLAMEGAQRALAGSKKRSKAHPDGKRIRELERDLDRKNRALAEVTALLALQKKIQAIWGDADENTPSKRET
jgi:transposase-like protein